MAIIIKGIKLITKKGLKKLAQRKVDKARKSPVSRANRRRARQSTKSLAKYNIHVGGSGSKGPVPIKKQSLQKSTLSGRTYSISNNKLSAKTMLDIGGGYGSTSTARFQDAVKDLIGLDRLSIRKAYKRGIKKK